MFKKIFFFGVMLCCTLGQTSPVNEPAPQPPTIDHQAVPALTPVVVVEKTHDHFEHAFIKMLLTLGGLLLLVFLTLWALRKLTHGKVGSFGSQKKIKILERKPLSPKSVLYLIEIDGKQVIVSESQLEVRSILNLSELEE